jgi:hypothetical protein
MTIKKKFYDWPKMHFMVHGPPKFTLDKDETPKGRTKELKLDKEKTIIVVWIMFHGLMDMIVGPPIYMGWAWSKIHSTMRKKKHDWFQKCSNLQDYFIEKCVQSGGGEGAIFFRIKKKEENSIAF